MKKLFSIIIALLTVSTAVAQTLNVKVGNVTYLFPASQAGEMTYSDGTNVSIMGKTLQLAEISEMSVNTTDVTDSRVDVSYTTSGASVTVAGNVAKYLDISVSGGNVSITQDSSVAEEITYALSGTSNDGSFTVDGQYKSTLLLNGVSLTSLTGGAVTINNGKRINVEVADGTTNTLVDAASGSQKACFYIKGHAEFSGAGTLNIVGNSKHAYRSHEYTQLKKKFTGTINITAAESDGMHIEQYFQQNAGNVNISGVKGDGIQVDFATDDDGNVETDEDNTGAITVKSGKVTINTTGDGAKGMKAEGNVEIMGGTLNITQSGNLVVDGNDLSYVTSLRSDKDINISGGTITINNTANGGKGLSAEQNVTIDETNATTVLNITANGIGGTAETSGESGGGTGTPASYKVYVSIPNSQGGMGGGGRAWSNLYLYKSDGTLVQQLTSTVQKSSGYSNTTFYYYDFQTANSGTYYFKSDDYNSRGTNYTIKSSTFSAPSNGEDVYYSISNSYSTSGSTRTYTITNVTSTYGGTSDLSEDTGTAYNAAGIKADGNVTIGAGTVTVKNSGAMSKSIKSKATVTINGGNITLTPTGAMQVINNDASYSAGVKAVDFYQNDGVLKINCSTGAAGRAVSATNITTNGGTLTITNSCGGQSGNSDDYTAKGLKADSKIALNAGTISITMTGNGGKGIKCNGTYTQGVSSAGGGTSEDNGPKLTVSTSGSRFGSSSSGGGGGFPGGFPGESSGGGSAKGIKVQGAITIYGGETNITTQTDGAEGLESKTSVTITGGKHYFACYDDCINCSGNIYFNGGVSVCYSNGNDAIDSNAGRTGAITIGDGVVFAYTTKGSPEEGIDCDNNSYIQITGNGIGISAGSAQGGGGGFGGQSSGNTISNAAQGYYFVTSTLSYTSGRYYTLADSSGKNLVTYSFPASISSSLALFTAKGMTKGSTYTVKYSTTAPTDAETEFHGLYLGSSHVGTTSVTSFTAQ